MKVIKTLQPGKDGTRRFQRQYGDRLVCVRYRHDPRTGRRLTTVELIAEEQYPRHEIARRLPARLANPNRLVHVRIQIHERDLQARIKAAGGVWLAKQRVWEIRLGDALDLNLGKRIVDECMPR